MNYVRTHSVLLLLGALLLLGSCGKSSYSTFSKPGETYKSAQEIAELKRKERQERRRAERAGTHGKEIHLSRAKKRGSRTIHLSSGNGSATGNIQTVISTARSYRGTPYKFGGTTRIGMDCSGLLCTSFQAINVQLPRTSSEQSFFGPAIATHELQAGDLVFFSASKSPSNITHVGLVTEVKSQNEIWFIHASTSLGVTEDNLFAPYYQRIFVKAIRPSI